MRHTLIQRIRVHTGWRVTWHQITLCHPKLWSLQFGQPKLFAQNLQLLGSNTYICMECNHRFFRYDGDRNEKTTRDEQYRSSIQLHKTPRFLWRLLHVLQLLVTQYQRSSVMFFDFEYIIPTGAPGRAMPKGRRKSEQHGPTRNTEAIGYSTSCKSSYGTFLKVELP